MIEFYAKIFFNLPYVWKWILEYVMDCGFIAIANFSKCKGEHSVFVVQTILFHILTERFARRTRSCLKKNWYNSADHRKSIFSIRKFFQSQYFSFSIKKRMEMWHCQYSIQLFLKYQVWILHGLHNRVRGIIFYEILYI